MAESRIFDGSSWITITDEEHRNASDPHSQYLNETRGDARYVQGSDSRLSDARTPTAHTHTSAQVTDLTEAVQDAVAAMLAGASGVTLSYDDAANTLTITGPGASGLDAEAVRDAIGVALIGTGLISVAVNDAADTITISTTATANATDAALRDRASHTGSQAISTVTGLQSALDGKAATAHTHTVADLSDSTATGRALVTAADAAAARTAIGAGTSSFSGAYADLTGKPTAMTPTAHEHTAADVNSGASSDGQVLTSDGAGGAAWETLPGVQGVGVSTVWAGSQAAYDAISTPDPNTLYFVTG